MKNKTKVPMSTYKAFKELLEKSKESGISNKQLKKVLGRLVFPGDYKDERN